MNSNAYDEDVSGDVAALVPEIECNGCSPVICTSLLLVSEGSDYAGPNYHPGKTSGICTDTLTKSISQRCLQQSS